MGWWSKREPVYSEVGEALYRSLVEEGDQWENIGLLEFHNKERGIRLKGWDRFTFLGWEDQGVAVSNLDTGLCFSDLTDDDHYRLHSTLAGISHKRVKAKRAADKVSSQKWIRSAMGLEVKQ